MNALQLIAAYLQEHGFETVAHGEKAEIWKVEVYNSSMSHLANVYLNTRDSSVMLNIGFRMVEIDVVEPGSLERVCELVKNREVGL